VFATGDLNDVTRELITVTVVATLNTLAQLKAHTRAALKVGVSPVELREAIYQLAPFIGFPRTLNAVAALNEVFDDLGVPLPLPPQTTTTDTVSLAMSATTRRYLPPSLAPANAPVVHCSPQMITGRE
jgi:4-carboxymuconolactone decarboxylase